MEDSVPYREIRDGLATGDLVLYQGTGLEADLIKVMEMSRWTHISMVVRMAGTDGPLVWESTPMHFLEDVMLHKRKSGPRVVSLDDRLRIAVEKGFYGRFAVRKLEAALLPEMTASLWRFMFSLVHWQHFPGDWELFKEFVQVHLLGEEVQIREFFCSELVAAAFMEMGLLPTEPPANHYLPKDFAAHGRLRLLKGARLGPIILFEP